MVMNTVKKVTINLPVALLKSAQEVTGEGITKTLKIALELLSKRIEYDNIRSYRGRYKSKLDISDYSHH